jgi:hypothetical protein
MASRASRSKPRMGVLRVPLWSGATLKHLLSWPVQSKAFPHRHPHLSSFSWVLLVSGNVVFRLFVLTALAIPQFGYLSSPSIPFAQPPNTKRLPSVFALNRRRSTHFILSLSLLRPAHLPWLYFMAPSPNPRFEGTAEKLRFSVPSARGLRPPLKLNVMRLRRTTVVERICFATSN